MLCWASGIRQSDSVIYIRLCTHLYTYINILGFLNGSVGKESAFNALDAEDEGLVPSLGSSAGEGHGNPL